VLLSEGVVGSLWSWMGLRHIRQQTKKKQTMLKNIALIAAGFLLVVIHSSETSVEELGRNDMDRRPPVRTFEKRRDHGHGLDVRARYRERGPGKGFASGGGF